MDPDYELHVRRTIGLSSMVRFPKVHDPPVTSPMEHALRRRVQRSISLTGDEFRPMFFETH
jgi:hypothetical protein